MLLYYLKCISNFKTTLTVAGLFYVVRLIYITSHIRNYLYALSNGVKTAVDFNI